MSKGLLISIEGPDGAVEKTTAKVKDVVEDVKDAVEGALDGLKNSVATKSVWSAKMLPLIVPNVPNASAENNVPVDFS